MIKKLLFLLIIFTACIKGFSQDDPCNAIPLPISAIGSCTYMMGNNTGATDSDLTNPNIDAPTGCDPVSANYNGADVWFYIDLGPTTTSIQIDLTHIGTSNFNDGVAALYTGTCGGALTIVECDDDAGSGALEANFSVLNVLTPNTRVYIRVWEWGGFDEGTFNICASEVEDPCNSITNITDCGTTPINATIAPGFGAFNDSSCIDVPGDEAVFSFTPTVTGNYTITQISTFDHINYLYQTNCAALGWTCIDDLFGNNETTSSFNMTAGTSYYIMLDSENSNGGNVSFTLNCPLPPPECGDTFYDSGGLAGDYSINEFETTLITPTNVGDAVTVTFSAFDTENGLDYLSVYDGPDATYPPLGTFSGTGIPGPFTSSDSSGALFFEFVSDGSVQYSGWEAIVSCAPYVAPIVCGSTFYDSGGAGGNYSNDENTTTTLIPDVPNTAIVANFTAFSLENNYDYLEIFDGPNNTFPPIGIPYTGTNSPGTVTSSHSSGALTFVFESDFSNTDGGWAANITCISNCNLIITDTNYPIGSNECNLDYIELTTNAPLPPPTNNIYTENFNGAGFPAGWTEVEPTLDTEWIIANSNEAGGTANEAQLDWNAAFDTGSWILTSPPITITGETNLELSYRQNLDHWSATYQYSIYTETSTDNTNWTIRNQVINVSADIPATVMTHNISSHDGNNTLYVRFRFTGETFGLLDWSIDDVIINADGIPLPPQVTWSPTTDLYTDSSLTTPYTGGFAGTVYAAPNGTQTYTSTDASSCTDMVTVIYNKKIWNGSFDTNWHDDNNWTPNGVPNNTNCVIIGDVGTNPDPRVGPPIPPTPAFAYNLKVTNGGYLELGTDRFLTVTNSVTVETGGLFYLRNSGSLIQIDPVANSGDIYVERAPVNGLAIDGLNYVYWSSPVKSFSVDNISPGTGAGLKWKWDPTTTGDIYGNWSDASSNPMTEGQGYIVRGLSGVVANPSVVLPTDTALFSGEPNNGDIPVGIFHGGHNSGDYPGFNGVLATNDDDNWNLIGNPYPSALWADSFLERNAANSIPDDSYNNFGLSPNQKITGTIWIWPHAGIPTTAITDPFYDDFGSNYDSNQYIAYNFMGSTTGTFNGFIASGQGFFVLADHNNAAQSGDNVLFHNGMRNATFGNSNFLRSANSNNTADLNRHRIWLNLVDSQNKARAILVGYAENATNERDDLYDGPQFTGSLFSFYSIIDNDKFAIQGRTLPFTDEDTIPLGLVIPQNDIYKIAINQIDGLFIDENQNIYLEDTYTNTIHNLRTSPYTFSSDIGTFDDRFFLRYTANQLGIEDFESLNGIRVFEDNKKVVVKSDFESIQSIEVFDILGRNLFSNTSVSTNRFTITSINPSETTLFLKIKLADGKQKIAKIIF